MEMLLIRHGQSEADLLDIHEGRADYPLTTLGKGQAERLAMWLCVEYPVCRVWTSPLSRAQQTASIIAQSAGIDMITHEGLMEWNNGVLAGLSRTEAQIRFPEPSGGRKPHEAIPGGESEIEFRCRTEAVFSEIVSQTGDNERIAVVSHGGTISNLVSAFLKAPTITYYAFSTGDTGCHLLQLVGGKRRIIFLNRQDHLIRKQVY